MAISPQEAISKIITNISRVGFEIVPIESAVARVCAQNIQATSFLPKFDNSAMDGYAIRFEDKDNKLTVIDTIFAGDNNTTELSLNSAIKIMTGARVPVNTTAIIPKEDTSLLQDETIKINKEVRDKQHIRFIGEDIKLGEVLIKDKDEINFAKITLLASQGISHIKVYKKPKIVVFASGEELKLHYEKAEDYQIYNSNTPTFIARCKEFNCDVTFIGQAHDSVDSIKESILNALDADLIITSGGVSVGDADFTKESFEALGFETIFDGIIIKPGKPTVFGKIDDTFILNLPGNPLASALIFELFGTVILQKLLGSSLLHHNSITTKISQTLKNKKGRQTVVPGFFDGDSFTPTNKRSPGMVSTLSNCNSFLVLDENVNEIKKDNKVKVLPINWKFFTNEQKEYLTYE